MYLCLTSTRIEEENVQLDNFTEVKGDTQFPTWRPPWMTCFRDALIPVKLLTAWKSDSSTMSRCGSVIKWLNNNIPDFLPCFSLSINICLLLDIPYRTFLVTFLNETLHFGSEYGPSHMPINDIFINVVFFCNYIASRFNRLVIKAFDRLLVALKKGGTWLRHPKAGLRYTALTLNTLSVFIF